MCVYIYILKLNMELQNQPLEKEIPFGNHSFQVPAVKLWRCMHILFWKTYQGTWSFSHQPPANPPRSRVDPSASAPCKLRRPGLAWVWVEKMPTTGVWMKINIHG